MRNYQEKKTALYKRMMELMQEDVCVAFSGGVDSSLLVKLAKICADRLESGTKVYAVTFDTFLHPLSDLETAKKVAEEMKVEHKVLFVNELEQEEIRYNPENRCYLCKKALFTKLEEFAEEKGVRRILEGSNEDDLHVYRPGLTAVKELGILSPLAECQMTKAEVRRLAEELELSVSTRPSTPCLATRLPYGAEISPQILEKIGRGEAFLRTLGFSSVRLRLHGEIARIEIPQEDFQKLTGKKEEIIQSLKEEGFHYITLDLEGFRSGSMDEILEK